MPDTTEPEKWKMALRLRPSPLVLAVMPSLEGTDSLTGNIQFNSAKKDLNISCTMIKFKSTSRSFIS